MSNYDVYGLGNALVDYEYEVSDAFLEAAGIEKGVMTLLEEDQQQRIVASVETPALKKASGGSGANSVIALAQLGGSAFYSCKVAADEDGAFYLNDMSEAGVSMNVAPSDSGAGVTGKCLVMVTPDAERTMNTFLGITGALSSQELDKTALAASKYLYLEGYLVTSDTARAAAIEARRHAEETGVKTAISLSDPNMVSFFKDGLLEMIGDKVDLLFANEEEAKGMAGEDDFDAVIAYLKSIARTFAVTRGATGSVVFDGENVIEIAPNAVTAVDTLGAGDMYAGAFLYGVTQGWDYEKAGKLASLASSRIVTVFGPRLAQEETQAILSQFDA